MVDAAKITHLLREAVSPERVSDRDFDLIPYSRDLSPASQKLPTHVVLPESREEIQKILKIANKENVPVYIRGGGTSHWDAYLAQEPGIMLDMSRMNKIIDINERDLVATVQPNCTWAKLDRELQKH
ncbi:MAG: FAD-binding oxidoreductase, partial [Candidatus Thorarchaeota archaeon]